MAEFIMLTRLAHAAIRSSAFGAVSIRALAIAPLLLTLTLRMAASMLPLATTLLRSRPVTS